MKAIIIDDEKHVREGILLLADWHYVGITEVLEATDGEEGIQLIKEHRPEIIFTDMSMPNKDGITLLKWIHSTGMDSKTIIISGYDDFRYMRSALFYGSFDYILKPIDRNLLNETLERAVHKWQEQDEDRRSLLEKNQVINEVKPLYWDRLFTGIIEQKDLSIETIKKVQKEFRLDIKNARCTLAILPVPWLLMKKFNGDRDVVFFALLNIVNEIVRSKNSGISFRNVNKEDEIIILLWNTPQTNFALEKIYDAIYQYIKMKCTIFKGDETTCVADSYRSASKVLQNYPLLAGEKKVVTTKEMNQKGNLHLLDYAQELKWALQRGSTDEMDVILQKLFEKLETSHNLSFEQLKIWENQFHLLRKNWLEEYDISGHAPIDQGWNFWEEDGTFSFEKFKEEKQKEFYDLMNLLEKVHYQKEKTSIQEIEAYLKEHYYLDIKLQDIAEHFFLSREYISRKFKQVYHVTITDYLANIRIEKSKVLLENPHLKIYDIAYEVGYKDEKYYSKVFKKINGQTPNEYRRDETRGRF
ncbi:response regulator transcription factor [Gracilibacillus kekensis]|uniref:Two-component system, response regulator YesN n=1 Tax=Gracilibacillus kekensis TaxID=1027249 RepID=A0A1M7LIM7_9BACI|nr:response regulator [Gracilibacillus kekensis]SHM77996.1 two-component system, response regulator YesN [Gracilibacillus kekensis]